MQDRLLHSLHWPDGSTVFGEVSNLWSLPVYLKVNILPITSNGNPRYSPSPAILYHTMLPSCHPTQMNSPRLNLCSQAGQYSSTLFIYRRLPRRDEQLSCLVTCNAGVFGLQVRGEVGVTDVYAM